jgi:hypothetical protein
MTPNMMNMHSLSLMCLRLEPVAFLKAVLYSCYTIKLEVCISKRLICYLIININNKVK